MNPTLTLPDVRPLATLCVFLFISSLPVKASLSPETTTPKTFADWCLNQANSSRETLHTINVMLQEAKTQDCHQAEKLLSTLTRLFLSDLQIADLRPLSSLTNLTELSLLNNQIADIKPLSTLTKLTKLFIDNNQITDLRPLSTLASLTELYLNNNQIADLLPLSDLTKLDLLSLGYNPSLTDKTCPVKPASTCRFVLEKDQ
jgi:internalin A